MRKTNKVFFYSYRILRLLKALNVNFLTFTLKLKLKSILNANELI